MITLNRVVCFFFVNYACLAQPNYLIFIADDLGIGDIGCYGNDTIKTPNIDYIANNGIKLQHNLAGESICTPSRAALLTGRYAVRFGLAARKNEIRVPVYTSASSGLPTNETTFANMLKSKHYTNGYFGKWHLGVHSDTKDFCFHPLNRGFDYYYGMPLTNIQDCAEHDEGSREVMEPLLPFPHTKYFYPTVLFIIAIMVLYDFPMKRLILLLLSFYLTLWAIDILSLAIYRRFNCILMRNKDVIEQPVHMNTVMEKLTKEAESFIEKSQNGPFLVVVAYHKVHTVLASSKQFAGQSKHGKYGDNVEELDWSVGKILDKLKSLNLSDKTLVYFTSDHGPALFMTVNGELHGGWKGIYKGGKGSSWEGGIRVPTVAMYPGVIPRNIVYDYPTSGLDLFPTLLAFANISIRSQHNLDGLDISHILKGHSEKLQRFLFHYCGVRLHAVTYVPSNMDVVWKLHYEVQKWEENEDHCHADCCSCFPNGIKILDNPLLFNLVSDPREAHSVSASKEIYLKVTKEINAAVEEHRKTLHPVESQLSPTKNKFSYQRQMCCNFPFCSC